MLQGLIWLFLATIAGVPPAVSQITLLHLLCYAHCHLIKGVHQLEFE